MTVDLHDQLSLISPLTTEKVKPVPKTLALSSNSDSLTELGDIDEDPPNPDFTGSSAPPASTRRTSRNFERIDYRKAHTGRASLSKTSSFVPINSHTQPQIRPSETTFCHQKVISSIHQRLLKVLYILPAKRPKILHQMNPH